MRRSGWRTVVSDYFEMTKPKVQSLLLFTTVTTMYVAGDPSLGLVPLTCPGGALSAGGAGAINHSFDRDLDRLMTRTADRPVALRARIAARRSHLRHRARDRGARAAGPDGESACRVLSCPACSATSSPTPSGSSARRRRTSSSAARLAQCRRWSHTRGHRRLTGTAVPVAIVFLDPAPLLVAVAADEGRVRARAVPMLPVVRGEA